MSNSTITAWTGKVLSFVVKSGDDLILGTFTLWEAAQTFAKNNIGGPSSYELYIWQGEELVEVIDENEPITLQIVQGCCDSCLTDREIVQLHHVDVCQECATECGEGENVWNYLRG